MYSVVYYDGDNSYYSGRGGIGTNVATIVNNPLFKVFSTDLKIKFYDNYPHVRAMPTTIPLLHRCT